MKKIVLIITFILFSGTAHVWGQWTSFLTNNSDTDYINDIVNEGNTVWAATNGGVVKWNSLTGSNTIFPLDYIPNYGRGIFCAAIDWNGVKWFGSVGRIYTYNDTTWFSYTGNNTDILKNLGLINSIAVDSVNKRIIFSIYGTVPGGSGFSLISFDGGKWEKLISFSQSVLWDEFILMDTVNPWNIWGFGEARNINYFKKEVQGYVLNRTQLEMRDASILSLSIDVDNRIWMATGGNICVWDRTGLSPVPYGAGITGAIGSIRNIVIDNRKIKWAGSDGSLVRYDNITWNSYPFQRINQDDVPTALAVDEHGDVWMGRGSLGGAGGYGLYRFHPPVTGVDEEVALPKVIKIIGNYPNPFNPSTTISISISSSGKTELTVYSVTGQKVRTLVSGNQTAGSHSIVWDGRDDSGKPVSSGVYFSRLQMGNKVAVGRMLLLK